MNEPTIYYFGVESASQRGHYLFNSEMRSVSMQQNELPFQSCILDAGLIPPNENQKHSEHFLSVINGWTILSMWDRSGDPRPGSNSSFIAKGVMSQTEIEQLATRTFPEIWMRIHGR